MSKLLEHYKKNIPLYDTEFSKTTLLDTYKKFNFSSNSINGQNLLDIYYKKYGYTSLISTAGGFLLGTNSVTDLVQNGLSLLVPGATRGGITSIALRLAGIALRNPFIENTINNFLPSPNILGIPKSRMIFQTIPPQVFMATNPRNIDKIDLSNSTDLIFNTIKSVGISALLPVISGLANTGTLSNYDFERAFGKGIDAAEIMILSQQGIKYTKPVAWIDMTKPKWSNNLGNYFTYDKYIGYASEILNYKDARELYGDTLENRFLNWKKNSYLNPDSIINNFAQPGGAKNNALPASFARFIKATSAISNKINQSNIDKAKLYQQSLGVQADPDNRYENRPDIREIVNRLGFPQMNFDKSKEFGNENDSLDKINMLDIGEDYTDNLKDTIKFKVYDIFNKETIIFRAILTDIADDVSPTWTETNYLGRADTSYTYDRTTRKISFTLNVYSQSKREVISQWRKINRLVGLCYPTEYKNDNVMRGPIVKLTLGDLYHDIYGYFDSINFRPNENTLWDIEEGFQLPMIVELTIGFTLMFGFSTPKTIMPHFNQKSTKFSIIK